MKFFNNLKYKFASFMSGRYGYDQFSKVMIYVCIGLAVINLFTRSVIFMVLEYALLIYVMFRFLSRNVYKRRNENAKFLSIWSEVKKFFVRQKNRFNDRKTHVYLKCPSCKAILRLPKQKGEHSVKCPRCEQHFDVKI